MQEAQISSEEVGIAETDILLRNGKLADLLIGQTPVESTLHKLGQLGQVGLHGEDRIAPAAPRYITALAASERSASFADGILRARFRAARWQLALLANLTDRDSPRPADWRGGTPLWGGAADGTLPPWSVFWTIEEP